METNNCFNCCTVLHRAEKPVDNRLGSMTVAGYFVVAGENAKCYAVQALI